MIRLSLSAVVLLAALAGCSSSGGDPKGEAGKVGPTAAIARAPSNLRAAARASIASAPDKGELVRYDSVRRIQPSGAYTSYPVTLSEAHAYNALAGGELVLTAPDGERLRLRPQRHEEYADGNWTLAAGDTAGNHSLLTFGQDAVFGSITRADGSALRVTTRGRQVYLVAADPRQLAAMENPGAGERVDMLLPPARTAAAPALRVASSAQVQAQAGTDVGIAAANDIDVLLGYTPGLVARIGSESGAVTRMQSIVAIANEAYLNSGVTMRLRLVKSMLVNYTDSNTNQSALQSLTGSSGSGSVPIDAAFTAFRAARESSGADLVSLVRQFKEPENDGCGIAWLLGGGQTAITQSDAPFGYSVVSDGSDVRESDGKTYFCRDETLAHELGHNMGQAHNQEDSTSAGAHAYSYGYRETSTTGFFTVMAYRITDSSQVGIRYFANPSVSFSGRPTGVANTNDNVRSMNLTMPIIRAFRAEVGVASRARNDFDGDARSDLAWWNASSGTLAYWTMNGAQPTQFFNVAVGTGRTVSSIGYARAQSRVGFLVQQTSGRLLIDYNNTGSAFPTTTIGQYDSAWTLVGQGDVDGNGKDEIFWRNPSTGAFAFWFMDGASYLGGNTYGTPVGYQIAALADFNGDGRVDMLWNAPSTRTMSLWVSDGGGFAVYQIGQYGTDWVVQGAADVTGDGKADILWRNTALNYLAYWRMDGPAFLGSQAQGTPTDYVLAATGDYNGDGRSDIVWRRPQDRTVRMWLSNGTTFSEALVGGYADGWTLLP